MAIHKVDARVVPGFTSRAQHWRGTVLNACWTPQQTSLGEGVERSRVLGASRDNEREKEREREKLNYFPTSLFKS